MGIKAAHGKYIAALLLFGLNGIVASYILLSSYEIVFTRTLIGSLFLVLVFLALRQKANFWQNRVHFFYLMISGMAMGGSWLFLYEAYRQIGVSNATLLYYCGPMIVMVLSPVLFKEKLTSVKVFGFIAVLIGMLCINVEVLSAGKTAWGLFCGAMSAVMYTLMVIFNKQAKSIQGLENTMLQVIASLLIVTVFLGIKQGFVLHIDSGSVLPILILGVVNTGIGCYLYFSAIGSLPVQTVAILGYLEPLSAVIFSVIFLSEAMGITQIIGAALILGGAAMGEFFQLGSRVERFPVHLKTNSVCVHEE